MAFKYLGSTYDIHTGGINLVFPHHENAIAISQALTGALPANYWVHNELVMVDGKKRSHSSSTNNQLTLRSIFGEGYSGREIRYWMLSRHYRKSIFFSHKKLRAVKNTVNRLDAFVQKVHYCRSGSDNPELDQAVYNLKQKFTESMDDDFNTSAALAALFQFIRRLNIIMDQVGLSNSGKEKIFEILEKINSVLDVMKLEPEETDPEADKLIAQREQARKDKDWATADNLRQKLKEMGIEVVDTKEGPVCRKI